MLTVCERVQGYSGMNRFNKGNWSMVQNSMVMAYLSYADFYRPRYWLLENVRNFVSHNKSFTFRLTVRTLLEMGYQVRFTCCCCFHQGCAVDCVAACCVRFMRVDPRDIAACAALVVLLVS